MRPTFLLLNDRLIDECKAFGQMIIDQYRRKASELSSHGAELNYEMQCDAKGAECAFALWADLDPLLDLNWSRPDSGYDVIYKNLRIDIKQTNHRQGRLVWPIYKNFVFEKKQFDVLVLMKGTLESGYQFAGWTFKQVFNEQKKIAPPPSGMTAGTWYMEPDQLWPADSLDLAADFFSHDNI